MFAIIVEYDTAQGSLAPLAIRQAYRTLLMGQTGYCRRLELRAGAWSSLADLFVFAAPEAVGAALASTARREFVARHPACRATGSALLVSEGAQPGLDEVVLLRGPRDGVGAGRRERFMPVAPPVVLW